MDREAFYRELGRRVSALRAAQRLTQAEIGEAVGASRAWVANLETGRQRLQVHQLYPLAAALGCERIDELVPADVPEPVRDDVVGDRDVSDVQRAQIESLVRNAIAAARPKARRN